MSNFLKRITDSQNVFDGTLCRQQSPLPGPLGILFPAMGLPQYVYCSVWNDADRTAFWKGFITRAKEMGKEFTDLAEWLEDAVGMGEDGDFAKAWEAFGEGLQTLLELVGKLMVVAGIPVILRFHPKRDEYAKELGELGLAMTEEFIKGYRTAYEEGGVPQCAGRLLADLARLALEIVATKGAGKAAQAALKVAKKVPAKLKPIATKLESLFKPSTQAILRRAAKVKLDLKGRELALYFGMSDMESKIPKQFATIGRMLDDTPEGKRILERLDQLPWKEQEPVWQELSERVAKVGADSGKPVHGFVTKAYHERMFPDAKNLKKWWGEHKSELIEKHKSQLKSQNLPEGEYAQKLDAYTKKLDGWTDEDIEAQHYAVKSKHKHSGKYEDEIFHKIEKLNLKGIWFHVINENGVEITKWWQNHL